MATVPETAQRNGNKPHPQEQALVSPELVAHLLDPAVAPSTDERSGLEQFLQSPEQVREGQYAVFRQHWYALQARDFKREILELMETYMSRKQQQEGQALTCNHFQAKNWTGGNSSHQRPRNFA